MVIGEHAEPGRMKSLLKQVVFKLIKSKIEQIIENKSIICVKYTIFLIRSICREDACIAFPNMEEPSEGKGFGVGVSKLAVVETNLHRIDTKCKVGYSL